MRTRQEVLKALRTFFEDNSISTDERDAMWHILTALRGPDDVTQDVKEATTAVIREHALGHRVGMIVCADFNKDKPEAVKIREDLGYGHFRHHVRWAFGALGLRWDDLNPPPTEE